MYREGFVLNVTRGMGNQEKKGDFESCSWIVGLDAPDFRREGRRLPSKAIFSVKHSAA
jgi:hypothetical protein